MGGPARALAPAVLSGALGGPVRPQAEAGQERRQQTRGDTRPAACATLINVRRGVCAAGGIAFLGWAAIRCPGASLTRVAMIELACAQQGDGEWHD